MLHQQIFLFNNMYKHILNKVSVNISLRKALLLKSNEILQTYVKLINICGIKKAVKDFKILKYALIKFYNSETGPFCDCIVRNKMGVPRVLTNESLNPFFRERDPMLLQMLLTLLSVTYLTKGGSSIDLSSIRNACELNEEFLPSFASHLPDILKNAPFKENLKLASKVQWERPHLSTAAGPIGKALYTSLRELPLLSEEHKASLRQLGGPRFQVYFDSLLDGPNVQAWSNKVLDDEKIKVQKPYIDQSVIRRITTVASPEGKSRVIAILDY